MQYTIEAYKRNANSKVTQVVLHDWRTGILATVPPAVAIATLKRAGQPYHAATVRELSK